MVGRAKVSHTNGGRDIQEVNQGDHGEKTVPLWWISLCQTLWKDGQINFYTQCNFNFQLTYVN